MYCSRSAKWRSVCCTVSRMDCTIIAEVSPEVVRRAITIAVVRWSALMKGRPGASRQVTTSRISGWRRSDATMLSNTAPGRPESTADGAWRVSAKVSPSGAAKRVRMRALTSSASVTLNDPPRALRSSGVLGARSVA